MNGDQRTITVKGSLGTDMALTRDKFVRTWVAHSQQFHHLSPSLGYDEVCSISDQVAEAAGREFDRLYALQQEEVA